MAMLQLFRVTYFNKYSVPVYVLHTFFVRPLNRRHKTYADCVGPLTLTRICVCEGYATQMQDRQIDRQTRHCTKGSTDSTVGQKLFTASVVYAKAPKQQKLK